MQPKDEAELAQIIAARNAPVWIAGGGTCGSVPEGVERLDTAGLSGVTLYEPGALTLVAKAGTPLSEIEAALDDEGQRLAFEPWDARGLMGTDGAPTIGGVVAMNASGPRRIAVGAMRDFMLGVRFVDGTGQVLKNGGRVMKNVTGYDLVKLMTGSRGALGVLTEVSLKVLPRPEAAGTVLIDGLTEADAVRAMSAALTSPYEVTGAAHMPEGPDGTPLTLIRVEGFETQVTYRTGALQELLAEFPHVRFETDPDTVSDVWTRVRDVAPFHGRDGDVWRISCKPSDGPGLGAKAQAEALLYDWGGGLIWALVPRGTDLRARLGAYDGHATRVRGAGDGIPNLQPEPPALAMLTEGLRAKFDPKGLFNPGLMA